MQDKMLSQITVKEFKRLIGDVIDKKLDKKLEEFKKHCRLDKGRSSKEDKEDKKNTQNSKAKIYDAVYND